MHSAPKKAPPSGSTSPAELTSLSTVASDSLRLQQQQALSRTMHRFTARSAAVQRSVAAPVLTAAALHASEVTRIQSARESLQRAMDNLPFTPGVPRDHARQRQARPASPGPVLHPHTPVEWVMVMGQQAEQAEGRRMDARNHRAFSALQRQVASQLSASYRQDRQPAPARTAEYARHLVALQRHPISEPVARAVLAQVPAGDRASLQRAVDDLRAKEVLQWQQDEQALQLQTLQRQLAELDETATTPVMERIQQRRGSGNPLPAAVQRHLEQGLNHDLSRVRIHDDAEADKLAKGVNAIAFTSGTDIYFQSGKFNPNTQSGLELLAHEATHTVQQSKGVVGKGIDPDARLEDEARTMGARLGASLHRPAPAPELTLRRAADPAPRTLQRKAAGQPSTWRQRGKLRGQPPVRDEASPPNPNIVEDEKKYRELVAGARQLLAGQRQRAAGMLKADKTGVRDYRFWFARVYSHVTENEIKFAEQRTFDYPSYVMQCVLYFDKLYADNLTAIRSKVEPHWKASFDTAQLMQNRGQVLQLPSSVFSLVSAMLAHIRFDLPRAEAWVAQNYQKSYGAKPADFRDDFFRMGGVFDNASRSMFEDMKKLLPDRFNFAAGGIDFMASKNWTSGAMRHLLGADMSAERLQTWKRMEALVAQGKVPANPYTLQGGRLTGTVTGKAPGSGTPLLSQIQPAALRPSMEGIDASWPDRIGRGLTGIIGSQLDTSEHQVATWQRTFSHPASARKVPVYERADILLTLIKNPAMRVKAVPAAVVIPEASPKDDALILSILKASVAQGDLSLLVNMVDAQTLLSTMEVADQQAEAELLLVKNGYYQTLGAMNATNQIQKWFEAGNNQRNRLRAGAIYRAQPKDVKVTVDKMLQQQGVPSGMYR